MFFKKKNEYVFKEGKNEISAQTDKIPDTETEQLMQENTSVLSEIDEENKLDTTDETLNTQKSDEKIKKKFFFDFNKFFKNRRKLGTFLIAASLIMLIIVAPTLNILTSKETVNVLVAMNDIQKGCLIDSKMITVVTVPKDTVLPIHINDRQNAEGQYAKSDIVQGEILSSPKISQTIPFDDSYLYNLPEGKMAVSISLNTQSASLSGKLLPDDIISIYASGEKNAYAQQYSELTYIKVLAVVNKDGKVLHSNAEKENSSNPLTDTVILLADDKQASLLVGLSSEYSLHAALICRGNEEQQQSLLTSQDELNNTEQTKGA